MLPYKHNHTGEEWTDCGQGTVLHPVSNRAMTTRVIEVAGWGRIGEWLDQSNESEANFRLILAAPSLLEACEELLAICEAKCKPDDVVLANKRSNGAAMRDAKEAIAKALES